MYNRTRELRSCLSRIVEGLTPVDALVVVDDGSVPPSVVPNSSHRVILVRHPTNRGLLAARNTTLRYCPKDVGWVMFVDSDQDLVSDWRTLVANAIREFPSAVLFWFDVEHYGEPLGYVGTPGGAITVDDIYTGRSNGVFIAVFRADLAVDYRFREDAWGYEGALTLKVLEAGSGRHIPRTLAHGPPAGEQPGSASTFPATRDRALALSRGAIAYLDEAGDALRSRHPEATANRVSEALTWHVVAGRGSLRSVAPEAWHLRQYGPVKRLFKVVLLSALPRGLRLPAARAAVSGGAAAKRIGLRWSTLDFGPDGKQ